jgi:eukaryotic-like serine/threonine-protein kinase
MAASPVLVGEVLADKYRVEEILGQGGMGIVVAAWHLELEQRVAVKFLLPEYAENKEAAERFRREARAAVKIQSEHVARVVDVGTMPGGIPYMVMEFLSGHDLATELERSGKFSIDQAVDSVFQTCLAIAEAHSKGVIHRDLKPANLFLTSRADGSRLVKVLDFGISKSIQGGSMPEMALTRTSIMVGSPLYMSPEQLESSKQADERSDIWSLGVILFELLTGTLPFTGDSLPQLVRSVLTGKYARAKELRTDVPDRLSQVIDRCLEIDKEKRIRNIADLADALAPFQTDGYRYSERIRKVLTLSGPSKFDTKTRVTGDMPAQPAAANDKRNTPVRTADVRVVEPIVETDRIPVYEDSLRNPPQSTNTANSWGHTGARAENARPSGARWAWASAAIAACALAGFVFWSRAQPDPVIPPPLDPQAEARVTPPSAVGPSTMGTPAAAPPAVNVGLPVRADLPVAVEMPAAGPSASSVGVGVGVGPNPSAAGTPAAQMGPPDETALPGAKPLPGKKPVRGGSSKPETASSNKPESFTDFGGRR